MSGASIKNTTTTGIKAAVRPQNLPNFAAEINVMLYNWDFMRLLRAGVAGWAFWQAFGSGEWIFLVPGAILGFQAIFNIGCCGSAGCYTLPARKQPEAGSEVAVMEEVK